MMLPMQELRFVVFDTQFQTTFFMVLHMNRLFSFTLTIPFILYSVD
jgi:hypothetical protein